MLDLVFSVPKGILGVAKEAARHLLRRPVVGVAAAATSPDGRWLLIQRPSGLWALPGGTLEWGETLETGLRRELDEEAGVMTLKLDGLVGVYSKPERDSRFHAVTVVVRAQVSMPTRPPRNPVEIRDVRLFTESELPTVLAHEMTDMLADARCGRVRFE
jgi:8-oxo-dGTP diphosphatase